MAAAGADRTFNQRLQEGMAEVGSFLYSTSYLLWFQIIASSVGALYCAYETRARDRNQDYTNVYLWVGTWTGFEWIVVAYVFYFRVPLKKGIQHVLQHYGLYFQMFRGIGVVSMLRLFVFISDLLGREKDLDGFSTAFFLLVYLHVVSVSKVLTMEDLLFLSDSLLAIAIMIAGGLDSVSKIGTAILDHHQRTNATNCVVGEVARNITHREYNVGRSLASYFAAAACVIFRLAHTPFGHEHDD